MNGRRTSFQRRCRPRVTWKNSCEDPIWQGIKNCTRKEGGLRRGPNSLARERAKRKTVDRLEGFITSPFVSLLKCSELDFILMIFLVAETQKAFPGDLRLRLPLRRAHAAFGSSISFRKARNSSRSSFATDFFVRTCSTSPDRLVFKTYVSSFFTNLCGIQFFGTEGQNRLMIL